MTAWHHHHQALGAAWGDLGGLQVPAHYGDPAAEYRRLREGCGLHDRSYRGLLEVRGADRAAWLHNLLTNHIKALVPGEGCYAFALNVRGRILFDVNVLCLADRLLLDLDRRWLAAARAHFEKYIIMEDVQLADVSDAHGRIALLGPALIATGADPAGLMLALGAPGQNPIKKPGALCNPLQHAVLRIGGHDVRCVRHDLAGPPGVELIMENQAAAAVWNACALGLAHSGPTHNAPEAGDVPGGRGSARAVDMQDQPTPAAGGAAIGLDAVQASRIRAGIPWPLAELDDQVLPAETGQLERAVSFQKGCYLGQEVVERMRAHRALARRLVGLVFDNVPADAAGAPLPVAGAALLHEGQPAGRITSLSASPAAGSPAALGYVKAAVVDTAAELAAEAGEAQVPCRVLPLL